MNIHVDSSSLVPYTYSQAFKDPNWLNAMIDEFCALISNKTWVLVPRPHTANVINCIWLFKKKTNAYDILSRYKDHLVAMVEVKDLELIVMRRLVSWLNRPPYILLLVLLSLTSGPSNSLM